MIDGCRICSNSSSLSVPAQPTLSQAKFCLFSLAKIIISVNEAYLSQNLVGPAYTYYACRFFRRIYWMIGSHDGAHRPTLSDAQCACTAPDPAIDSNEFWNDHCLARRACAVRTRVSMTENHEALQRRNHKPDEKYLKEVVSDVATIVRVWSVG